MAELRRYMVQISLVLLLWPEDRGAMSKQRENRDTHNLSLARCHVHEEHRWCGREVSNFTGCGNNSPALHGRLSVRTSYKCEGRLMDCQASARMRSGREVALPVP